MRILNAGSSTILGRARIIAHAGGDIGWEGWLSAEAVAPRSWRPAPSGIRAGDAVAAA
jgi:hypothetical protein